MKIMLVITNYVKNYASAMYQILNTILERAVSHYMIDDVSLE